MIQIKRVYDKSLSSDNIGYMILVDRLWPRGIAKDKVRVDIWLKDIAPSDQLRRWFGHDPAKWEAFKERYLAELESKSELVQVILDKAKEHSICLLYGAKDETHNHAAALKELIDNRLGNIAVHDKIIAKALGDINRGVKVELKECMALGDEYCRHIVRSNRVK